MNKIISSLGLFVVAGLCEIGGGWLVWQWLKSGKPITWGFVGGIVLFLYGVVATLQTASFSRTYAAYGGIFIVLSLLWGAIVDKTQPDRFDVIGAAVSLVGVFIIMYWPRT
jgi:small multidrug resistance family-3 protein